VPASITKKPAPDRGGIDMRDVDQVKYPCRHLGVSEAELLRTVDKVGNSTAAVRKTRQVARFHHSWRAPPADRYTFHHQAGLPALRDSIRLALIRRDAIRLLRAMKNLLGISRVIRLNEQIKRL
jgi:hypothetical protein